MTLFNLFLWDDLIGPAFEWCLDSAIRVIQPGQLREELRLFYISLTTLTDSLNSLFYYVASNSIF